MERNTSMGWPLTLPLRRSPPDLVYTPIDVTSRISEGPLTHMLNMSPIQTTNNRADAQKRRKEADWSLR